MRGFEKISFKEFKKEISDDRELYDSYELPKRKTAFSAGYDFFALEDITIEPGEIVKIKTGVKVFMLEDEMLTICVRSSMGFKYNIRLVNQIGIFDQDYYNNPNNEGHMFFGLQNEGKETFVIKKGEAYGQGIFMKYLIGNDIVLEKRVGGIGSTNKEENDK